MTAQTENKSCINGILLLNKRQGVTSNRALQEVKRLFGAKKAGHTGSLDPLATGMLPICFGEATKISQFLLDADKNYQTTGLLGIKTNTGDSTGEVVAQVEHFTISETQLIAVLSRYTGALKQVPSMFSALKHQGTPLYKFAREGREIERQARDIFVSQLQLDSFDKKRFSLTVSCSKGTYIRNLVEDIGEDLKVGAHVVRLHRPYTSGFQGMKMYALEELQECSPTQLQDCLIPMDRAVEYLPALTLTKEELLFIRQGRELTLVDKAEVYGPTIRLYNEQLEFVGLGEVLACGQLRAKRLLSF